MTLILYHWMWYRTRIYVYISFFMKKHLKSSASKLCTLKLIVTTVNVRMSDMI